MKILIVEDEIKIRHGMANLIANHTKHTVAGEAKNGQEGLEMVLKYRPDLVITDIRMPVMDGLEMIQALHEKGIEQHCVILSGYSEFDYAKQAIRFGVDDYLIKPLAPEDVTSLLDSVQRKISEELKKQQGTPEKALRDYLLGASEDAIGAEDLILFCDFERDIPFRLLTAYMGTASAGQNERKLCLERFEKLKMQWKDRKIYFFFMEGTKEFVCVTQDKDWEEIRAVLEQKLLSRVGDSWVWLEQCPEDIGNLREAYLNAGDLYPYGMVLGQQHILTAEEISGFRGGEYRYPGALELELQTCYYRGRREGMEEAAAEFIKEMSNLRVVPELIKEGYIRMASFLLELAKENNRNLYEKLQKLNLMKNMGLSVTGRELELILWEEFRVTMAGMGQKEDISNYTIKRAIDFIRNHYFENSISLDAVAEKLDITPEYLSTLFNREMGENFTVFLKKFRISHAKRLLKGTDKKIYEIAQEVGYGDPKYFNRVFKEEEGVSPGDYRMLHGLGDRG